MACFGNISEVDTLQIYIVQYLHKNLWFEKFEVQIGILFLQNHRSIYTITCLGLQSKMVLGQAFMSILYSVHMIISYFIVIHLICTHRKLCSYLAKPQ